MRSIALLSQVTLALSNFCHLARTHGLGNRLLYLWLSAYIFLTYTPRQISMLFSSPRLKSAIVSAKSFPRTGPVEPTTPSE